MFELQQTDGCVDDAVLVYDGKTESSSVKKLCNRFQEGPFISTGQNVLIKFMSDNTLSYRGFDATYEVTSEPSTFTTVRPPTTGKCPQPKCVNECFLCLQRASAVDTMSSSL